MSTDRGNAGAGNAGLENVEIGNPDFTSNGDERRVPGTRGQATRQRLVDQTLVLLDQNGFRGLRVADIAREAGTSPATFYQYFGDIEDALLALLERLVADVEKQLQSVADRYRASPDPQELSAFAEQFASGFLAVWSQHRSLIRVVELQAGETDTRLKDVRRTLLNDVNDALEAILEAFGRSKESSRPASFVLVAMLANVAAHQDGMRSAGVSHQALVQAMAHQVVAAVEAGE